MDWTPSPDTRPGRPAPAAGGRGRAGPRHPPIPVKIVIAGGFGVGKTTAVASISEIAVLTTEAAMTEVAAEVDRTGHTPAKTVTTVALDFGRLSIDEEITLYLFGTPGQDRFGFMWQDLIEGALGAMVIVDTRRLSDGYPAVDYFERSGVPFVVGVNLFDGRLDHRLEDVRWALAINNDTPVVMFDARRRASVRDALVTLLRHVLANLGPVSPARPAAPAVGVPPPHPLTRPSSPLPPEQPAARQPPPWPLSGR